VLHPSSRTTLRLADERRSGHVDVYVFLIIRIDDQACACAKPRQVCTAATCFGFLTSEISKILTPRKGKRFFFALPAAFSLPVAFALLLRASEALAEIPGCRNPSGRSAARPT